MPAFTKKNIPAAVLFGLVLSLDLSGCTPSVSAVEPPPAGTKAVEPKYPEPSTARVGNGALIDDGQRVPVPPELTAWLEKNGYRSISLVNETGQVKVSDIEGVPFKNCGVIEGTTLPGKGICPTSTITPTNMNVLSLLVYEPDPKDPGSLDDPCITIEVNGYLTYKCWKKKK